MEALIKPAIKKRYKSVMGVYPRWREQRHPLPRLKMKNTFRRSSIVIFATYIALTLGVTPGLFAQELKRLSYNNPGLVVDLGVGLWAWPLPMDYNDDGLTDLLVVCTDTPYNGVYYFENSGVIDEETDLPIFKPSIRLGKR